MEAQRLLDLALMFLVFVGPSIVTAVTPHPSKVQEPIVQALLLFLGRLSVLRHGAPSGDSPGTLHWPLTAQPAPRPQALYLRSQLGPLPPPSGPGGPVLQRRRLTPAITWLAAPAVALVLLSAPGCAPLTAGKRVVAQGMANNKALAEELTAYSVRTEREITTTPGMTQEAADRTAKPLRGAVDLALKLLERSAQNLRDVATAMGVKLPAAAPPGGGAP